MMKKITIETVETAKLSENIIVRINSLKNQHWRHSEEEHMRWFKKNIKDTDAHLLIWEESDLIAYLNIVDVDIIINQEAYKVYGIGNV